MSTSTNWVRPDAVHGWTGPVGKPGGPWPPTAQEAVAGAPWDWNLTEDGCLPLEAWEGQDQGWSLQKGPWCSGLIPQSGHGLPPYSQNHLFCLVLYGPGLCRIILVGKGESWRGLICILNQQIYPSDDLEEYEGNKFFHFKMPCTIKGLGWAGMQFQASYIFLCYNYFLSDHPTSLPSLARCQWSSVDSGWNTRAPPSSPSHFINL